MNTDPYKRQLLAKEQELLASLGEAGKNPREQNPDCPSDVGDESVNEDMKDQQFTEADAQWRLLSQIRDALKRIQTGAFGRCMVDSGTIDEKRLVAMPWTPYCLKYQQEIESCEPTPTPTL